jgi:DegV family protein with EDD domain
MDVRVVVDSAGEVPMDLADRYRITVVPLNVRFGDEELVDGVQLDAAAFWRRVRGGAVVPQTSAPAPGRFEVAYRTLADDGADAVVCVTLSTPLSATFQAAQVAAAATPGIAVTVFDSGCVSMGEGSLALRAATLAADGAAPAAIVAELEDCRGRTHMAGTVDTLEYLRRGGRIGAASALLGSVLSVKPLLELRDGVVAPAGKVRTRHRALQEIVRRVAAQPVEGIWVSHGDAPDVDVLDELLAAALPDVPRTSGLLGPVVGSHGGPGSVLVSWRVAAGASRG